MEIGDIVRLTRKHSGYFAGHRWPDGDMRLREGEYTVRWIGKREQINVVELDGCNGHFLKVDFEVVLKGTNKFFAGQRVKLTPNNEKFFGRTPPLPGKIYLVLHVEKESAGEHCILTLDLGEDVGRGRYWSNNFVPVIPPKSLLHALRKAVCPVS
jgi:hypothetical protein